MSGKHGAQTTNAIRKISQVGVLAGATCLAIFGFSFKSGYAALSIAEPESGQDFTKAAGVPRFPDVSASQITFLYAGELWVVGREGGMATSVTKEAGPKSSPKFSADGRTIAFTGDYDGIYSVSVSGGPVTRLTHKPGATDLCGWTPDGGLLFMTNASFAPADFGEQAYLRQLFLVPAKGGLPRQVPLEHAANGAISADGQWLAFTPYAEGRSEHRMRYHGGFAPEIWIYGLSNHQSKKITTWSGTNTDPMWNGQTIYYLSDDGAGGRRNIWSYQMLDGRRRQITRFTDFDVKWPSMGPGLGGKGEIVFVKGAQLYLLDLATEVTHAVGVTIPPDRKDIRDREVDTSNLVSGWNPSPDGTRAVVEARGALWVVSAGKEAHVGLPHAGGTAQRYPSWSPDGRWIAYFSDADGEYQLYLSASDGSDSPRQASQLGARFLFSPVWSPDSKYVAFTDGVGNLYLYSARDGGIKTIHHDPLVRQPQLNWSPDSSWLAFTGAANGNQALWLYDIESGRSHQVTGGGYNDGWPTFDPDGNYLFFVSDRNYQNSLVEDSVDYSNFVYSTTQLILAIPLRKNLPVPWQAEASTPNDPAKRVAIDLEDMERRAAVVVSDVGTYSNLGVTRDGKLLYTFTSEDHLFPKDSGPGPSIKVVDFRAWAASGSRGPKTVLEGVNQSEVKFSGDAKNILIRRGGVIGRVDPAPEQKFRELINVSGIKMQINPPAEWRQIFTEAWRLYRDFFYDPSMRGVDWQAMREKYLPLLEACADREDVDYVTGEMLGELGSSHVYLNPPPGNRPQENIGLLGADFEMDHGAYRFTRIYDSAASDIEARSPLRRPGIEVREGDYLLAVDGKPIDTTQDPWAAFEGLAGESVRLTVSTKPLLDGDARQQMVQPEAYEVERHRGWVESNRAYVERKSGGRIGYLYLKMTSEYGLREFTRQFGPQLNKQAMISDIRWNQGGGIPYHLLDLLRRETAFYSSDRRRTIPQPGPNYLQNGPKCLLINGVTQSGGDLLADLVKQSGAATLVGTRTTGKWTVEGYGVPPDVEAADDPTRMFKDGDPQLDAAIRVLMDDLRNHPSIPSSMPF